MPLLSERFEAIIAAADEASALLSGVKNSINDQLEHATAEFFAADGNNNPLAASLLARLQALADVCAETRLSERAVAIISTEREHFRHARSRNARARRSMRNRRNSPIQSEFEAEY